MLPIGYAGAKWIAWPIYKDWREKRFLELADTRIAEGQFEEANILLRQIIRANPRSLPAWRSSLRVADALGGENSPFVLQQLLVLEPGNTDNRLRLATVLFKHRAIREAGEQLNMIPEAERGRPDVLRLAAEVARTANNNKLAERLLVALLKLSPDDIPARIDLAGLRLKGTDLLAIDEASAELRALLDNREHRIAALRLLLGSAMRLSRKDEVRELASQLKSDFNATFADRLMILSAEKMLGTQDFTRDLEAVKREAEEEASKAQMLADFLLQNRMFTDAEQWLGSLPEEILARPEIAMRMSEALFNSRDWETLEEKMKAAKWDRAEFYRLALLSYAMRAQNKEKEFRDTWQLAVIAAEVEPRNYKLLLDQADRWGWKSEKLDLLWRVFQKDPTDDELYNDLIKLNRASGNTVALSRVFQRRIELKPSDDLAKNNLAFLSLLLNTNLAQAFRLARDAYEGEPESPFKATTYAFAFFRQNRFDDAIDILNRIPAEDRARPERALYVGAILAAKERWSEAEQALSHVVPAQLLPEERQLLDQTRTKISAALAANSPS
jgi:predicted Zn-dependent protease